MVNSKRCSAIESLQKLMRHRAFFISLLLLPALLLSGWGGVIAAAVCAQRAGQRLLLTEEEHECCRARLAAAAQAEHCQASAPSSHEAMTMDEMEAMPTPSAAAAGPLTETAARSFNQLEAACQHCFSRREAPATFISAPQPEQKKRDANYLSPPQLKMLVAPNADFAPALSARQNAPPGQPARRHLLLSVIVV
jgi:hypothetical protein